MQPENLVKVAKEQMNLRFRNKHLIYCKFERMYTNLFAYPETVDWFRGGGVAFPISGFLIKAPMKLSLHTSSKLGTVFDMPIAIDAKARMSVWCPLPP